ncbi:MAG: SDR family oxidoreductase [Planctomycetales bacterium]|nr:SDR family oxidoreductase [Planctomycetales bacterium]
MRVFVTGGTGLLGNTIIRKLCQAGYDVLALVRGTPAPEVFAGLDVEFFVSDLAANDLAGSDLAGSDAIDNKCDSDNASVDPADDDLDQAIASCDAVIHSAALIHLGWNRVDESMRVNRDGTRRIVGACLNNGKKLTYIGTVNAIALGSRQVQADENTPTDHAGGQVECAYVQSKRASLQLIHQAVKQGLDAAIIHPGFMLGPWDWKPSSGRMLLEVGKGWKPIAPSGGCSLCDSRDVADGVIAAMKANTVPGREFIMAGHNWTYQKLWAEMAKRMGTRPPIRAAGPGMEYLAGLAGDLLARVTGKEPDFNSAGVTMSAQYHWYSSQRAITELGYQIRDADETLDTSSQWIRDRFILPTTAVGR